jgi:hypothetical protein
MLTRNAGSMLSGRQQQQLISISSSAEKLLARPHLPVDAHKKTKRYSTSAMK